MRTRRVAVAVAPGVVAKSLITVYQRLAEAGATPRFIGAKLGVVPTTGAPISVEVSMAAAPSVLFDALVLPDGKDLTALAADAQVMDLIKDQYRHGKPILAIGTSAELLKQAGVPLDLPSGQPDPGLVVGLSSQSDKAIEAFVSALARHRHFERETDPPIV